MIIDVETLAVTEVQSILATLPSVKSFIATGDKEPSWDGHIYLYSNEKCNKTGITKIPTQVKGHLCEGLEEQEISFSAEVADLDNYYIEQRIYFEKLIKLAPQNVLILSFSYNIERENLIHVNTCFDSYSMMKFYEALKNFNLKTTVFIPKCERNSISQMVYLSKNKSKVFVGKCMPIILNPSLMNTLKNVFEIEGVTSVKADLEKIF